PAVPPCDRLGMEVGTRPGIGEMRIFVDPWSDDGPRPPGHSRHRLERRVAIAVGPAGDHQRRYRKAIEVFRYRPMLPERVTALVAQPFQHEEGLVLETLQPHVAPAFADDGGVGWPRLIGEHGGRP